MAFLSSANTVIDNDRIVKVTSGASGSRPGSPSTGMMFFNTTSGKLEVWNGSAWKEAATTGSGEISPLWAWGNSFWGELGDNTTTSKSSPVSVVGGFTDWVHINCGFRHTAGIRANGTLWTWGRNSYYGQLGDGTTTNRSSPVSVVGGFTDWVQTSGGIYFRAAIRSNGTAWCWGKGSYGILGDNTTTSKSSPVSVVGGFTDWVQLSCNVEATAAIRANGTAWGWGRNYWGNLGDNTTTNRSSPVSVVGGFTDWVQIASGDQHVMGIRSNGTAWGWGLGGSGQLGDNTTTNRSSPVSVVGGFTDWVQIVSGEAHTVAIRANGTAWAWGWNNSGQVGDNTTSIRSSPVSVIGGFTDWVQLGLMSRGRHTIAIRANGTAWAWGLNSGGQLGDGTSLSKRSPVSVIGGFTDWVQISASGGNMTAALRSQPKRNLTRRSEPRR
jgi:alpha-tubulin suppressor-like RCC1 family protein